MKIFYQSFGCKVSQYETENIEAQMKARGFETVSRPENADIAVINTCTVTSGADSKCRQAMHRVKKQNPRCILCAMGCMTQVAGGEAAPQECDIVIGSRNKTLLPELIGQYLATGQRIIAVTPITDEHGFEAMQNTSVESRTRAYIKIQDGCDRFCTYCIIPYARGRCRSRSTQSIRQEALRLYDTGFRDIVLCGINLACWEDGGGTDLANAAAVCAAAGFPRIRLGSLEPDGLTDHVLDKLAAIPALCPHFHISVQSGCDRTLAAMHRHYTCAEFAALLHSLRERFPGAAITTDIMAGFPGETEEDFQDTLSLVRDAAFSSAFTFIYSPRPGTPAAKMANDTPHDVIQDRFDRLAEQVAQQAHDANQEDLGQLVGVLVEGPSKRDASVMVGHSEKNRTVHFQLPKGVSAEEAVGKIARVRVEEARTWYLRGSVEGELS